MTVNGRQSEFILQEKELTCSLGQKIIAMERQIAKVRFRLSRLCRDLTWGVFFWR